MVGAVTGKINNLRKKFGNDKLICTHTGINPGGRRKMFVRSSWKV